MSHRRTKGMPTYQREVGGTSDWERGQASGLARILLYVLQRQTDTALNKEEDNASVQV